VTFDDLLSGTAVFVDANSLVYAVTADPRYGPACKRLLERIDNQDLQGFTSAHVLSEMAHRVMTLEATTRFNRPLAGMANWLRRHPAEVQQLARHRQAIDEVRVAKVQVLPVEGADVSLAVDLSVPFGLLSNDALIVGIMQRHRLSQLASLDADLDRRIYGGGLNKIEPKELEAIQLPGWVLERCGLPPLPGRQPCLPSAPDANDIPGNGTASPPSAKPAQPAFGRPKVGQRPPRA
jgi:predicted nucleic acid-binding protein